MTKNLIILLWNSFLVALGFHLTACTLHTSIESLDKSTPESVIDGKQRIVLKMMEEPLSLEIYEGSSVLFVISQSSFRDIDTAVELNVKSDLNDISDVFPGLNYVGMDLGKKDFKITSNQTMANLVINSNHISHYTGDKTFVLSFKTSDAEVVNNLPEIKLKIKDLESPPQINFSASSINLSENVGSQSVTVNLSQSSTSPISVNYSFTAGTATAASDYIATAGSLTFAPGETSKTIPFTIVDDTLVENGSAETFTLSLGSVVGSASVVSPSSLLINIVDNDTESLSIANATSVEGSNVVFTVSLTQSSPNTISVDYATSNGTALAGTHYTAKSGSLIFAPGETSKTISVASTAISSEVCASDRNFNLTLSNPSGASIAVASATGTITDPDIPSLSIANASATEGSALSFIASLSAACANKNISFNYASSAVSATSGVDYVAVNSTASITAGNTSVALSVSSLQDSNPEGDETFTVTISSPTNATINTASATGTINDDEISQASFNITGITGASDANLDAYLSNGTTAIVNWQASTGSTSYDVTLFENDGTTVKCATQNSTTTNLDFASYSCNLIAGTNYKVKVVAKVGTQSLDASNNLYSFYVNQSPVLGSGGNGNWYVLAGDSITVDALWAASPAVGVATDPEGDSLSFSSVASTSLGTLVNNSTSITYTAGASSSGVETFSFTILDSKGGALTQTMRIHVMTVHTWTGAVSNSWATVGNWCGSISADKRSCVGGSSAPGATHTAIIDDTCTSVNCTPTNSTLNISVAGLVINANGFTQGSSYTVTVGTTTGFSMSGGTFTGSSSNVTINGSFTLSGGVFNSTSGTLFLSRNISISSTATFNHNNGTVDLNRQYSSNNTLTLSSPVTFNNFIMRGHSSTTTVSGTAKVNGTMTTNSATGLSTFNGGVVELYGDVVLNNSNIAGTTVLRWKGSNNQTLTGVGIDANSEAPYLDVDKSGGVLTFVGSIPMRYYNYTAGTIDAGTSLVYWQITYSSNASYNFSSIPFYDLNIKPHSATATLLGDMYVSRHLSISAATGDATLNGHKIYVGGNLTMVSSTTGVMNPSTTTVVLNGSGNQTIDNGVSTGVFPNVEIASTGGIVTIAGTPNFQNFVYNSGTVQVTAATVTFHREYTASYVLTPGPIQFNNVNIRTSNSNTALTGSLVALGNFTVNTGVGVANFNGGEIQVGGNLTSPGFGGTSQFLFNGTSDVSITSTGTRPSGKWTVNKSTGSIALGAALSLSAAGQSLDLIQGSINMAGYNLTINNSLNLSAGTSVTKNGGVLTVAGSAVAAGAYGSGTVNP